MKRAITEERSTAVSSTSDILKEEEDGDGGTREQLGMIRTRALEACCGATYKEKILLQFPRW